LLVEAANYLDGVACIFVLPRDLIQKQRLVIVSTELVVAVVLKSTSL